MKHVLFGFDSQNANYLLSGFHIILTLKSCTSQTYGTQATRFTTEKGDLERKKANSTICCILHF